MTPTIRSGMHSATWALVTDGVFLEGLLIVSFTAVHAADLPSNFCVPYLVRLLIGHSSIRFMMSSVDTICGRHYAGGRYT